MSSSSSAEEPHNHRHESATTAAPPPTPSINTNLASSISTSEALSALLHRLPPTLSLSLPSRRSSTNPPLLSLSDPIPILHTNLLSASTKLGFFHLKHQATYPAADSLLKLPHHKKQLLFPNNWPLGYDEEDDDHGESFCIDFSSFTNKIDDLDLDLDLDLDSLREFTSEMENLGSRLIRELASVIGFENPTLKELCSLLWIADEGTSKPGRVYPYVVGLHYVPACQKSSLCSDSGWVNVSGQEDSVLITLGDIAQVWSNGRLKIVRGRPMPCSDDGHTNSRSRHVTLSLLITLPVESMVFPLPVAPKVAINTDVDEENGGDVEATEPEVLFHSFPFEDYAWRVYHERLLLKDPLLRYRI